eukprot:798969_1
MRRNMLSPAKQCYVDPKQKGYVLEGRCNASVPGQPLKFAEYCPIRDCAQYYSKSRYPYASCREDGAPFVFSGCEEISSCKDLPTRLADNHMEIVESYSQEFEYTMSTYFGHNANYYSRFMSGLAFPVRCVPPFRAPPHVHASAMKLEFSYDTAANNSCLAQLPEVTCDLYCRARPVGIAA